MDIKKCVRRRSMDPPRAPTSKENSPVKRPPSDRRLLSPSDAVVYVTAGRRNQKTETSKRCLGFSFFFPTYHFLNPPFAPPLPSAHTSTLRISVSLLGVTSSFAGALLIPFCGESSMFWKRAGVTSGVTAF